MIFIWNYYYFVNSILLCLYTYGFIVSIFCAHLTVSVNNAASVTRLNLYLRLHATIFTLPFVFCLLAVCVWFSFHSVRRDAAHCFWQTKTTTTTAAKTNDDLPNVLVHIFWGGGLRWLRQWWWYQRPTMTKVVVMPACLPACQLLGCVLTLFCLCQQWWYFCCRVLERESNNKKCLTFISAQLK